MIGPKLLDRLLGRAARQTSRPEAAPSSPVEPPPPPDPELAIYADFNGRMPEFLDGGSPRSLPLYTDEQLTSAVRNLRALIEVDESPACRAALATPFGEQLRASAPWYQRIDFPERGVSSTSDHGMAYIDEGGFNTLAKRLTSREASILRPMPKWAYLEPLLPPMVGKSVLEIGSCNGFFSFRFLERGAAQVTGIEVVGVSCEMARWSAETLGHRNVRFLKTDFLLDTSIEKHDIVFLSEVQNHFLLPFLGLLKLVNVARETLVLDTVSDGVPDHGASMGSGWFKAQKQLIYHTLQISDGLLLDFLNLVGVPPSRVTRYSAPDQPWHNLYVIDTRDVAETRARRRYPEYLLQVMELEFRHGPG